MVVAAVMVANAYAEERSPTYDFIIEEGTLGGALDALVKVSGVQLVYPDNLASMTGVRPVIGQYTVEEALDMLFRDTEFSGGLTRGGVIIVSLRGSSTQDRETEKMASGNTKKALLASVSALMFGGAGQAVAQGVNADGGADDDVVIVTATRREQNLQEVPISIATIGADEIAKRNLVGMDDYLRTVPGVSMQERGAAGNSVVIRGASLGPQNQDSTAGIYFGDVPLTNLGSSNQTGKAGSGDVKLVDIERVEVLRGPQGTLYGAGSLVGTVRVQPAAPKLGEVEGRIAARYSHTGESGSTNSALQGVVNIPLVKDELALRAVGYWFDNSGYIENVAGSQPTPRITAAVNDADKLGRAQDRGDVGATETTGFRLSALWQPTDALDLTLSYLRQEVEQDGQNEINLTAVTGDYQQVRLNTGVDGANYEHANDELEVASFTANYDLGFGTVTNIASWLSHVTDSEQDGTFAFFQNRPFYYDNDAEQEIWTNEFRFASDFDGPFQFVAGVFIEDRDASFSNVRAWGGDPAVGPTALPVSHVTRVDNLEQLALFGEGSLALTDRLTAIFGVRHFDYTQERLTTNISNGAVSYRNRPDFIQESGQNYKASLDYDITDDMMVYGTWSQGFRLGQGAFQSSLCEAVNFVNPAIDSDRTENFEVGTKTSFADNRITLNAAAYQINWSDIPVVLNDPCRHTINAGKARTRGFEAELNAQLTESVTLDLGGSFVDATLRETSSVGNAGDDLPGSADFNVSAALEYEFMLGDFPSFARVDYAYVGEYYNSIAATGIPAGDFSQVHLKIGTQIGDLNVDLFANNLTNSKGLTWVESSRAQFSASDGQSAFRIRPRTIGINVGYQF